MFFHTPEHIYLTYLNDQLVVLDLRKDQYMFLSKKLSDLLCLALKNEFTLIDEKYFLCHSQERLPEDFNDYINALRERQLLCTKDYDFPYSHPLQKDKMSKGMENLDWRMPAGELDRKVSPILMLEAYLNLIMVYTLIKFFGFYGLIRSIKKRRKSHPVRKTGECFTPLVTALNKACFYFPVKTKCLEWAAALTFMGLRRGWECNIEIGVQSPPFAAHAWVSANNEIIADVQDLPKNLSVILSEPF